jgi:hypothetical protein
LLICLFAYVRVFALFWCCFALSQDDIQLAARLIVPALVQHPRKCFFHRLLLALYLVARFGFGVVCLLSQNGVQLAAHLIAPALVQHPRKCHMFAIFTAYCFFCFRLGRI